MTVEITDVISTTITPPFSLYHKKVAERHVVSGFVSGSGVLELDSGPLFFEPLPRNKIYFLLSEVSVHYRRVPGSVLWGVSLVKARGLYAYPDGRPIGSTHDHTEVILTDQVLPEWLSDFVAVHCPCEES